MKLFFTLFLALWVLAGSAQSKLSYELYYAFDLLSGDDFIGDLNQAGYFVNYSEFNYTTGINVRYQFLENLSLRTGMNYSNQEVSKTFSCPVCGFVGDVIPVVDVQRYLQVPIGVSYDVMTGKLRPALELGALNNILVAGEVDDILGSESPAGYYLSSYAGARLYYQVSKKVDLVVGYRYSRSLMTPFESDFSLTSNSINFGLAYRMNQ